MERNGRQRVRGTVSRWLTSFGYGFIISPTLPEAAFVHLRAVENLAGWHDHPNVGDEVEATVVHTERGPRALSVWLLNRAPTYFLCRRCRTATLRCTRCGAIEDGP